MSCIMGWLGDCLTIYILAQDSLGIYMTQVIESSSADS